MNRNPATSIIPNCVPKNKKVRIDATTGSMLAITFVYMGPMIGIAFKDATKGMIVPAVMSTRNMPHTSMPDSTPAFQGLRHRARMTPPISMDQPQIKVAS